jgi:transposase
LKLVFLVVSRVMSLLRLSRRESWWKDAEILMLRHQLAVAERERPKARARLAWPDRAWLALLAGTVPAGRLAGMRLLVTPGTILRWHCDIVRRRWGHLSRRGRSGRPATHRKVRSVVLRLARENESWGYRRIHSELGGLGITVAPSTVWEVLKNAGIGPAPRRDGPGWAEFLRSQAQGILALDFLTADLLSGAKVHVLAVIEHGTRRVRILGATEHPVQAWVVQQARNLVYRLVAWVSAPTGHGCPSRAGCSVWLAGGGDGSGYALVRAAQSARGSDRWTRMVALASSRAGRLIATSGSVHSSMRSSPLPSNGSGWTATPAISTNLLPRRPSPNDPLEGETVRAIAACLVFWGRRELSEVPARAAPIAASPRWM